MRVNKKGGFVIRKYLVLLMYIALYKHTYFTLPLNSTRPEYITYSFGSLVVWHKKFEKCLLKILSNTTVLQLSENNLKCASCSFGTEDLAFYLYFEYFNIHIVEKFLGKYN